jgi:SAM-dependent methyltransferase
MGRWYPNSESAQLKADRHIVSCMSRSHLFEFHELPWFPAVWRDLLTDFLSFYASAFKPYSGVAPLLADALKGAGDARIIDVCSGAGQPLLSLLPALRRFGVGDLQVTLTDKYPNLEAREEIGETGGVVYLGTAVDAADVPADLKGFRTLFTSFHHFRPDAAREVLADAVRKGEGVGIFEYTERNWLIWTLPILLIPAFIWLSTPFIRPFRWRRFLWTYLIPVVPIVAMWDGFVSNLRTYSVSEIRELVRQLDHQEYQWKIGRAPSIGMSRVTYAIGFPKKGREGV